MTTIVSWNIQNGQGCDGEISMSRIAETINAMGEPDVICLQEVSINMKLSNGNRPDQVRELTELFPGYSPFFGVAVDIFIPQMQKREQFGNLILSRYPILSVFYHHLPQPYGGFIKQMPRQAIEVSVQIATETLRIVTTHLEYHSFLQRYAQSERIMQVQREVCEMENYGIAHDLQGPYTELKRPSKSVICGDFNFLPNSEEYTVFTDPGVSRYKIIDAWTLTNPGESHASTCGVYDNVQWPAGPHCRDFMFVTPELADIVKTMIVNTATAASDHQPILLDLKL